MKEKLLTSIILLIISVLQSYAQGFASERSDYIDMMESYSFSFSQTLKFENHTVLVYHYPFDLGKSDISVFSERLLISAFDSIYATESRPISEITVFGHTDLINPKPGSSFDKRSICNIRGIAIGSNECLGLTRSEEIHRILKNYLFNSGNYLLLARLDSPIYHHSFFLNECNLILEDSLYNKLNIASVVTHYNRIIGLPNNLPLDSMELERIRNDSLIQVKIKGHDRVFSPFRSVIIINTHN